MIHKSYTIYHKNTQGNKIFGPIEPNFPSAQKALRSMIFHMLAILNPDDKEAQEIYVNKLNELSEISELDLQNYGITIPDYLNENFYLVNPHSGTTYYLKVSNYEE